MQHLLCMYRSGIEDPAGVTTTTRRFFLWCSVSEPDLITSPFCESLECIQQCVAIVVHSAVCGYHSVAIVVHSAVCVYHSAFSSMCLS